MAQTAKPRSVCVGDIKVSYLPDGGGIVVPTALYPASDEAGWEKYAHLLDDDGKFITTIGGYLIESEDRKIIVDTGMGPVSVEFPGFGPFFGGRYFESLAQTGVSREQVTDVLFTHLHLDHCGWTTIEVDGKRALTFPNARYRVTQTEWDSWYGGDALTGPHPEHVQKPLENRVEWFEDGEEVAPGLTVLATPGHTEGHISLVVTSGNECLYLVADVLHGPMQIEEPDWSVAFDADPVQARTTRDTLYAELLKPNALVAANHFSNEVFGRIVEEDGRRRWEPLF